MARHYLSLDQLVEAYAQIVISPHLDDAALSCGGMIAAMAAAGRPVLVLNVCSGSPASGAAHSPFAQLQHARWGLHADEAVRRRLAEDEIALEILGADSYQLDLLDAIYRLPEAYRDEATLFGVPSPADLLAGQIRAAVEALAARFPQAILYAPLGVGRHVDHQAAHAAAAELARAGASVAFYEDFPYVARPGALDERLAELGGAELFTPVVTAIDGVLARKIGAIEAYASQIETLFGDSGAMARSVTEYAEGLRPDEGTYGERLWVRR